MKAPIKIDEQKSKELVTKKPSELEIDDREYLEGMFEVFCDAVEQRGVSKELPPNITNKHRYTPLQMWENIKAYFNITIQRGQPLTKTGIALFNDFNKEDLIKFGKTHKDEENPYFFLNKAFKFVELYNEYAVHKKRNPAGPIFVLKNMGWSDKLEVEAYTRGAMTPEERESAQRRIANFSE